MTTNNEDPKPADNMELLKQQVSACGSDCGCHGPKAPGKMRWVIGIVVLVAAGALVVKAVINNKESSDGRASAGFAALPTKGQTPAPSDPTPTAVNKTSSGTEAKVIKTLGAFSELNLVAADTTAVFMMLPGKGASIDKVAMEQVQTTARTIEAQANAKVGLFILKEDSADYGQVANQMSVPGVLAMVKGRGMVPVSGEITEAKLIQAFVAASNAGGCGAGGCGPSGCK